MAGRIRVGVTGNARSISPSWWCIRLSLFLTGATAVRISVHHNSGINNLDALIISGGDDISPEHYGGELQPHARIDAARDELEMHWIKKALATDIPLLGICRGAQLINVVLGGSLHQDLTALRKLTYNRRGLLPTKQVKLQPGSLLSRVCRRDRLRVNSLHHQAVFRAGTGLTVSGVDLDNITQAIESDGIQKIIGVQWHPEYLFYLPSQLALFRWLHQHEVS